MAISALILGPSGAGKSSFIRSALKSLGSGAVAMAPGRDEENSYTEFFNKPGFAFEGFDDPGFLPSLGKEFIKVEGLNRLLRWQQEIFTQVNEDVTNGKTPRYAVFAMDTVSAFGTLAQNTAMVRQGITAAPPAQSPEGFAYYSTVKQYQEQMFRIPRALKGLGVHFIAVSHVAERDTTEINNVNTEGSAKIKSVMAAVPGGFRDILPSYFDLVLHAGVTKRKIGTGDSIRVEDEHYLKWKPDPKKPTKSRVGNLTETARIPNDFDTVMKAISAAVEERSK